MMLPWISWTTWWPLRENQQRKFSMEKKRQLTHIVDGRLMVLHLFDIILRPQQDYGSVKQLMNMCEKAQRILLYILEVFGAGVFDCVWNMFRMHGATRLGKRRHVQMLAEFEDEDEEPYECSLTEFDDLWDLTARAIEYVEPRFRSGADRKEPSMDAPGGKLVRECLREREREREREIPFHSYYGN